MKADFHMHTSFSTDSQSEPEEMIQGAIAKGLQTICITDHQDAEFPEAGEFEFELKPYFIKLPALKEQYKEQIDVRIGVEIGLQPHLGQHYRELVNAYPFDFVIGSTHVIRGMDPYNPKFFGTYPDAEGYQVTFEEMLHGVENINDFDVLGHIDYVARYDKKREKNYSYGKFKEEIDEILRKVIEKGKGIELNTSGYKYGLGFCHPHPDIIKRYRELGGEIITVGADGHRPDHIAYDFEKVFPLLKECGFKYYTEFKQRKPIFKQLP